MTAFKGIPSPPAHRLIDGEHRSLVTIGKVFEMLSPLRRFRSRHPGLGTDIYCRMACRCRHPGSVKIPYLKYGRAAGPLDRLPVLVFFSVFLHGLHRDELMSASHDAVSSSSPSTIVYCQAFSHIPKYRRANAPAISQSRSRFVPLGQYNIAALAVTRITSL